MPRLGPRIRKQDKGAIDRRIGKKIDKLAGIVPVQPDIAEIVIADIAEQFDHAVDKRLTADDTGLRIVFCLPRKMLATAETDFEPQLIRIRVKKTERRERPGFGGQIDFNRRQQVFDQRALARPQSPALPPPVKYAAAGRVFLIGQRNSLGIREEIRRGNAVLTKKRPL